MVFELVFLSVVTACACAIPGSFLVLRRQSLMSDAISHSVLPGIVFGFLWSNELSSPLLIVGALAMGLVTAILTELISKTRLVKNDAAIGIVFPALFSLGVILISVHVQNVHLDSDAVLNGEVVIALLDRFTVGGQDLGSLSAWRMSSILGLNLILLLLFYKELKLSTFDPGLASTFRFKPSLIHYAIMVDVSITSVGAFDAVGSILVVACMIVPAASAFLLAKRLSHLLVIALLFALGGAVFGSLCALAFDLSVSGSIAVFMGILFAVTYLSAPKNGLLARFLMRRRQKLEFSVSLLLVHLLHHQKSPVEAQESRIDHFASISRWTGRFAHLVQLKARHSDLIKMEGEIMKLTQAGERQAVLVMED